MSLFPDELLLALIRRESRAREDALAALRGQLTAMTGTFNQQISGVGAQLSAEIAGRTVDASAIVGQIRRAQVEPGFAEADDLTLLESRVGKGVAQNTASIEETRQTVTDLKSSFARTSLSLRASVGDNQARIEQVNTVLTTDLSALAERTDTLESVVNDLGEAGDAGASRHVEEAGGRHQDHAVDDVVAQPVRVGIEAHLPDRLARAGRAGRDSSDRPPA